MFLAKFAFATNSRVMLATCSATLTVECYRKKRKREKYDFHSEESISLCEKDTGVIEKPGKPLLARYE